MRGKCNIYDYRRKTILFCISVFQSPVARVLWTSATRPLHCSAVQRSMEFYPCPEGFKKSGEVRPVVVLFGWLLAKSRHLHKYGELYHQYGADVITVKLEVMEVSANIVFEFNQISYALYEDM